MDKDTKSIVAVVITFLLAIGLIIFALYIIDNLQ